MYIVILGGETFFSTKQINPQKMILTGMAPISIRNLHKSLTALRW
ncbi:hypothetical protein ABNC51_20095 [Paenibacillus larvae]